MLTENRPLFRCLFFINFAVTLGFGIADAFFSVFAQGVGARGLMLGAVLGFYAASKIIFSPFMGALSDRFGRRIIIVTSLSLFALISFCYLGSTSLPILVALRILQGISCAMFRPVILSLVGENAQVKKRGSVVATFDISFYSALSLGPLIGGILMDHWGFDGIFILLAGLCLSALVAALIYLPADHPKRRCATAPKVPEPFCNRAKATLRHSALPGLLVFIFGRACGIITFVSFMPILLSSKLGLSGAQIGMIMTSSTLVMTACLRPMGKLADSMSRPVLVIVGGTMVSLFYLLIPQADTFNQMVVLGVGIGLFSGLSQPASTSLLVEVGKRFGTGFAVGTFHASLNLGLTIGSIIGALLLASVGLTAVFYSAGLLGLLAVALFSLSIKTQPMLEPLAMAFAPSAKK